MARITSENLSLEGSRRFGDGGGDENLIAQVMYGDNGSTRVVVAFCSELSK